MSKVSLGEMMRRSTHWIAPAGLVAALVAGLVGAVPEAQARRNGPFGLGIILGDPSGLSAKLFQGRHAFDFALDFSFRDDAMYMHGDYLIDLDLVRSREVQTYVGIGARVRVNDHDHGGHDEHGGRLAARVPFGIAWEPRTVSMDVFFELVPVVSVYPDLDPGLNAGLGARYYF